MKILNTIGKEFSSLAKPILEKAGEVDYLNLAQDEFEEKIVSYDAAVLGLGLNLNEEVLRKAKNLKVIATATTGLDHIDLKTAQEKGIEVLSLKGEEEFLKTIAGTAELAFGLLIDLSRMVSAGFESVKKGEWDREKFRGHNLRGKTLGILGLGRLGQMMAKYGLAFGMRAIACDPYVKKESFSDSGCRRVDFETLLKESDAVSIHVHLSEKTEGLFSKESFEKMKDGALLINTSRGKIVNEEDLIQFLKNGKIGGYAADVLTNELKFGKKFESDPLVECAKNGQNVIITPHIGGMTYESREATDMFISQKLLDYVQNNE